MNKSRESANLVSENNIYIDIENDRVGIGTTIPSTKLSVSGNVTAIDFNSTSDQTLKINIEKLNNSIEILKQINPVSFNWKDNGDKSYGVIAQELEKILPELVKDNNGTKTVSYIPLIALLIDAVLELNQKLEN
jgi:hypothetical protein